MAARITAFVVWAAVAACLVFWGLRLFIAPSGVPSQTQPVSVAQAQRGDVLRLFASAATPMTVQSEPALAARFKLFGVMAPKNSEQGRGQGVALIGVDDKPPRAYRVGARIDNTLVLKSVAGRSAMIGPAQGAAIVQLDLPLPAPPATGQLPPTQADGFLKYSAPGSAAPPPSPGAPPPLSAPAGGNAPPVPPQPVPEDDPSNRR